MTHDLLSEMLSKLEARIVRIAVTELRENTFYALITVAVNGSEIEIDSRPSDAIALAVRSDAPIFADDSVIEESAIEFEHEDDVNEEQMVEEFKKFLDDVKPDDFIPEALDALERAGRIDVDRGQRPVRGAQGLGRLLGEQARAIARGQPGARRRGVGRRCGHAGERGDDGEGEADRDPAREWHRPLVCPPHADPCHRRGRESVRRRPSPCLY
jgi:hypothetical protein